MPPAGAVSFTTADPGEETEGLVRVAHEFEASQTTYEGIYSTPITDTFGVRVALRYSDMRDGYYDNIAKDPVQINPISTVDFVTPAGETLYTQPFTSDQPAEEEMLGRITLKWTPSDDLSATLKYTHDKNEVYNSSWNYQCWASTTGNFGSFTDANGNPVACNGGFYTAQGNMPLEMAATFPNAKSDGRMYNEYKSDALNLNVAYSMDNFAINWITNSQENDNDWACNCDYQIGPGTVFATESSSWKAFSTELRMLTTNDGPLNGMLGVLYQKTDRDFAQWVGLPIYANVNAAPENRYMLGDKVSSTDGETFSIFGQLIWSVSDTVEVTAGARYTDETKKSDFVQPFVANYSGNRPADDPLGVVNADQQFYNLSPEATVTWKPADDLMFYLAYKTGYKSGGFSNSAINAFSLPDPVDALTFNEEKAKGFELGMKSTLMDNQVRFNATAYSYDYTDLQVDFFRSDKFAFNTFTADATVKGIEVEVEYAPNAFPGLSLYALANYNKSEYDNSAVPCYAGQGPATGCTFLVDGTLPFQNVDGVPTAMSPEWTGVVGGRYSFDLTNGLYMGMSVNARFSDDYLASSFNQPLSAVDSYWYVDANIRIGSYDSGWELAVIGKNLTDESYITGVVDRPNSGTAASTTSDDGVLADQLGFGNIPRTIAVEALYRF